MITVVRYQADHRDLWDDFIAKAKNGLFLFRRGYLEYHCDRFPDHSLLFFEAGGRLVAILPATSSGEVWSSHSGLTFGGVVCDGTMKVERMLHLFDGLVAYLRQNGIAKLVYKPVPHIYHTIPAEEDLYALHCQGARLVRRDVALAIALSCRVPYSKGRRWAIKQSRKHQIEVIGGENFGDFMIIQEEILAAKYNACPAHSAAEIEMLAGRFPENIRLYVAQSSDRILAGVIIYVNKQVARAQYIATTDEGRRIGALDCILDHLINETYAAKAYFDFGTSSENDGASLNLGLIENKQSYGGRAIVYDMYEMNLAERK